MATQAEVVDYIKNLKLSEVKALISILEDELGVKASAPVVAVAGGGGAAPAAAEPVEEKTEFTVVLKAAGANKINVIKAIRELTGLGLKEAKDLVEGAPQVVKENIDKDASAAAAKKLIEAGAEVEVK